ncbi:MAG TPA: dihydrolipoamide acetyltransferase family protein [Acidimicrobiales bacterium]|nr:dihydrolipoamide acetyltransferase family protein [Acidimicrobiales bacterium]
MGEFVMPSLGADMEAGTILEWRVGPGDVVRRGDIVAVVDTEKSDIEVEVFEDGRVEELLVDVGRQVPVGTPLARLAPIEAVAEPAPEAPPAPVPEAPPAPAPEPPTAPPTARPPEPAPAGRVKASPLARRLAEERGVDLAEVTGSGHGGAIVAGDVPGDHEPGPPRPERAPAPDRAVPERAASDRSARQAAMRHAIGELMARSKREIPHYHLASTIELSTALGWLAEANARRPIADRLLPAALLLKATALAARAVPVVNGFWRDGFEAAPQVHLGVAVSLRGGGLVAPAIHDADTLSVDDLMAALRDLVERARSGRLRSSEMSDPTLTVTNLGDQGAEEVLGVIYPPQVALVGFGRIVERPWAVDGMLAVRPTVRATLAADHRASDGHDGSRFLTTLDRLLTAPEAL